MHQWIVISALLTMSCESYVATDGRVFALNASHTSNDPWPRALVASGEHDLSCPTVQVRVGGGGYDRGMVGMVEGCGERATYNVMSDRHLILIAKVRIDDMK